MMLFDYFSKDDCTKTYKIGEELGRGSFAVVKRAQHLKEKTEWAVKVFDKRALGDEDEAGLRQEVSILKSLKHPHIVELREVFDTKKTFYMIMELMSGGELFERIVSKSKYSEREASVVTRKIASALKFCHDKNVVHRDLKPENLLYTDSTEAAEIKIADFGFAKLIAADKVMATACGTPGYVAPEVLNNEPYTSKVDMWSLGVIIYILLCGFPPFYDENNAALFQQVRYC
jgi:calcium/calmodulin-dependent protein kinase I